MMAVIDKLSERYEELAVTSLGRSILGKNIPLLQLGSGRKKILYIGAHHGDEGATSALLLRFVNEYMELCRAGSVVDKAPLRVLNEARCIYVVPMLNPDGVDYAVNGITEDNPLRERVLSMNGGDRELSRWQANARGVDLKHNYNAGFEVYKAKEAELGIFGGGPVGYSGEYPESEPEVGYLCNFIRFTGEFSLALSLHTVGEEISCATVDDRALRIGKQLAGFCDYRLVECKTPAIGGGFAEWVARELGAPAFTVACGNGDAEDFGLTYLRIRKMLYMAPMLV